MNDEPLISQSLIDSINSCGVDNRVFRELPDFPHYFVSDAGICYYSSPNQEEMFRLPTAIQNNQKVVIIDGRVLPVASVVISGFYPEMQFEYSFKDGNTMNCALDNLELTPKKAQAPYAPPRVLRKPDNLPDRTSKPELDRYEEAKKRFRQKNGLDS